MAAPPRDLSAPATGVVLVLALAFAGPLSVALALALAEAADAAAWSALWADPQLPGALSATLLSALAGTGLALGAAMAFTTRWHGQPAWRRLERALAPLLAVPHAAFAIGLVWLLAPSGVLARALAPLAGWDAPPDGWPTPGIGLALVLALKELPFLLWSLAALLARPELARRLQAQQRVARTLGYGPRAWWWLAGWPQVLPLLRGPVLAVLAYGLTVVDLALVAGPTQPPTLAVLAFGWLQDGDPATNVRGAVAAVLLGVLLAALIVLALLLAGPLAALQGRRADLGRRATEATPRRAWALSGLQALYAAVGLALLMLSVAGPWPFPQAWPEALSVAAWREAGAATHTLGFTLALALTAAALAVVFVVAWLEATPARWDARVSAVLLLPLWLPPLLLVSGLYRAALHASLDGTAGAVLWAHLLFVLPYAWLLLQPAWRDLDPRYARTVRTLGRSRWAFRWQVQRPMLAAPLAGAAAVAFAASVAQYLPTQLVGAGRHPSVTTEAVTLASGGDRRLAAAFALLQALPTLAAFALAAHIGRRALR